jgi:hypothetical protein
VGIAIPLPCMESHLLYSNRDRRFSMILPKLRYLDTNLKEVGRIRFPAIREVTYASPIGCCLGLQRSGSDKRNPTGGAFAVSAACIEKRKREMAGYQITVLCMDTSSSLFGDVFVFNSKSPNSFCVGRKVIFVSTPPVVLEPGHNVSVRDLTVPG